MRRVSFHDLDDQRRLAFPPQLAHRVFEIGFSIERLIMLSEALYREFSGVFRRHVTLNVRQLQLFFAHRARDAAPPFTSFQVLRQPRNLSGPRTTGFASNSSIRSMLASHSLCCEIRQQTIDRERDTPAAEGATRRRLLHDLKADPAFIFNRRILQTPVRVDPAALPCHGGRAGPCHDGLGSSPSSLCSFFLRPL